MGKLALYQYIVLFSVFMGLIRYRQLSPSYIRLFIPFLALTFLAEVLPLLVNVSFQSSNHWWFNIFTVIEFLFYIYIFSRALKSSKASKVLLMAIPVYLLIAIINMGFIQGFNKFHTISYRLGAIFLIVCCYLYFRQLMHEEEEEVILWRNPLFWIATGLLFFYLGFFMYMNAFDYIVYNQVEYNIQLWNIISFSLNTLLYSCFTIALLCSRKSNRLYNSS